MLALFRPRSPLPPVAVTSTTTDALKQSLKSFQECLEPDQKAQLEAIKAVPDARAVAEFTHQLDQENAKRKSRCVAARISPLLESIQQFSGVVETFVSSNPHIAALVWGSVKLVLQIASNFTTYFDKLSALLMAIGKRCPRFDEYQKLYRDSTDLQKVLCDFYSVVVRCCEQAVRVIRRTGYMQLIKAATGSFNSDFGLIMSQVDQSSKEVHETIRLAEAKLNTTERRDQRAERDAAEQYRLGSIIHRKEREKVKTDRWAQMQLEKQSIRQASKLEQFCNFNHKIAYWKARTKRHGSTGQWLTRTDQFTQWVTASDSSVIWFTGNLGSGKTVMTAYVVEQLSAKPGHGTEKTVYFFCQYDNETSLQATTVLRSIIKQLLDQDDDSFAANEAKIDALLNNLHDLRLLEALFSDIVERMKSVVVVLDGIDECSNTEMKMLLKTLRSLMLGKHPSLKFYLAGDSRVTDLVTSFLTLNYVVNTHRPEAGLDLQELVQQLVASRREDKDLVAGDPSLYQEIVNVLCTASQGMILWIKFQLAEICSQKTDESIRLALKHLPKDLFETYNRLLSKIVGDGSLDMCNKVFRYVSAAKRPLSLEELGEAISVEPCQPYFMPERLINDTKSIVRWCHGLIALDELDETLQFAHSSVKDFFCSPDTEQVTLSGFHFRQNDADRQFGEVCVTYLNFNDFKSQLAKLPRPEVYLNPLMMASHALKAGSSNIVSRKARDFMERRTKPTSVSSNLLLTQSVDDTECTVTNSYCLLQYAAAHWHAHTSEFSSNRHQLWSLFTTLAEGRNNIITETFIPDHRTTIVTLKLPRSSLGGLSLINYTLVHRHSAMMELLLKNTAQESNIVLDRILLEPLNTDAQESRIVLDRILLEAFNTDAIAFLEPLLKHLQYPVRSDWLKDALIFNDHNLGLIEALILSSEEWTSNLDTTEFGMCLECMIIHNSVRGVAKIISFREHAKYSYVVKWVGNTQTHVRRTTPVGRDYHMLQRELALRVHVGKVQPLELAVRLCRAEIVELLCNDTGHDLGIKRALDTAVFFADARTVKILLACTKDLGDHLREGDTVLHLAVKRIGKHVSTTTGMSCGDGYPSRAPWLDIGQTDSRPWDYLPMITLLLEEGKKRQVNLNVKDELGNLPRDYADRTVQKEIDKIIQKYEIRSEPPKRKTMDRSNSEGSVLQGIARMGQGTAAATVPRALDDSSRGVK